MTVNLMPSAERLAERSGPHLQRFAVTYEYPVHFTEHALAPDNPILADCISGKEPSRRHRVVFVIDDGVAAAAPAILDDIRAYAARHAATIELAATPRLISGGERAKNDPSLVETLQRELVELRIDRHAFIIAIGGGAVLDLAGFVAATLHRGIRHIRMPTTVLAQDDSGVGVKNGVNAFGIKNLVGCFAPPFAVINDFAFLERLDPRDRIAGMAEAVKVALIRDAGFFAWIEAEADALAVGAAKPLRHLIRRCAELHMRQIAHGGDPFEMGSARPLDYGHWAAHKLEALTEHALRHGEAVSIGMALDARYAVAIGLLEAGAETRICRLLQRLGLPIFDAALSRRLPDGELAVLAGLREFREHLGGELTITLLERIGRGVEVHSMDEAAIAEAIRWLGSGKVAG
jgi:3-dehydroquinate synthase